MRLALAIAFGLSFLGTSHAAQRQFVASYGDDTNPCSLVQPCRSLNAAIAAVDVNGEVIVLDSAGYGTAVITKDVSIVAPPGIYAGTTVPSGGTGIEVNASNANVVLRGLTINALGGLYGIRFVTGKQLTIDHCIIANATMSGIDFVSSSATLTISNSELRGNGNFGISSSGSVLKRLIVDQSIIADGIYHGIYVDGPIYATVTRSRISGQRQGWGIDLNSTIGARLAVADSVFEENSSGGVHAESQIANEIYVEISTTTFSRNGYGLTAGSSGGSKTFVTIDNSNFLQNDTGIGAGGTVGTAVVVSRSTIAGNYNYGMAQDGGAQLLSTGDNVVHGNNYGNPQQNLGTIGTFTRM